MNSVKSLWKEGVRLPWRAGRLVARPCSPKFPSRLSRMALLRSCRLTRASANPRPCEATISITKYLFLNRTIAALYIDWDLYLSRYKNKLFKFADPPNLQHSTCEVSKDISVASIKFRDSEARKARRHMKVRDGRYRMNVTDDVGSVQCGQSSIVGPTQVLGFPYSLGQLENSNFTDFWFRAMTGWLLLKPWTTVGSLTCTWQCCTRSSRMSYVA